jgi:hypothetical protein
MNPTQMLFERLGQSMDSSFFVFLVVIALVAWLWSVVVIAREKTEDPFDRIVWLMIVLLLNIVGTILYVLFSGSPKSTAPDEAELKRRANEGDL